MVGQARPWLRQPGGSASWTPARGFVPPAFEKAGPKLFIVMN